MKYDSGGVIAFTHSFCFQDGSIEFEEFIRALSVTSRGNLDEKLHCKYLIFHTLPYDSSINSEYILLSYSYLMDM